MIDTKTIDSLTLLKFKNYEAKERWLHLIKYDYFEDVDTEITIDFARRWGKLMQYYLKSDLSNFEKIISTSACDANADNNVQSYHAVKALDLLIEHWQHGDILKKWADKGGRTFINNLF